MKIYLKLTFTVIFLFLIKNVYSYEIIRDPIFENYFNQINEELRLKKVNVYLVKNNFPNAFVLNDNIYITTELLNIIKEEDTMKAIFLHEYGHIIKNHLHAKRAHIQQSNNKNAFFSLFSIGLAVISGNSNIGLGTSISLNSALISEISNHSVSFEIEADNFMINQIIKNRINTSELITFLQNTNDKNNVYFRTHPKNEDRVLSLKKINFKKKKNSDNFEWLKSKYSNNSSNKSFNNFFKNLEKGIFDQEEIVKNIDEHLIQYEAFKKGFLIDDWQIKFHNLLKINDNSFLKIEYINYLIDNNFEDKYYIIDDLKFDNNIMNEYFYYYIYGKYYNKLSNANLSYFYFCQFYKAINSKNKADFFVKNMILKIFIL